MFNTVDHYENFPVASLLLPRRLREPVRHIYTFARQADDIADEGDAPPDHRLGELAALRGDLARIAAQERPASPVMQTLAGTICRHGLPLQPFYDLLDAFAQDVLKQRYAHFGEVMAYCRRSAAPIGRLLLALYGENDRRALAESDAICAALQLINFLQDIAQDYARGRIYLPQDEMEKFGVTESQIAQGDTGGTWWPFMRYQIERARKLLKAGAPLGRRLRGRAGLELRLVILSGETILRKIHAVQGDVFHQRPTLTAADWPRMLWRAVRAR